MSQIIARNFGVINAMANITSQTDNQRLQFSNNNNRFGSYQTDNTIWNDLNTNNSHNITAFTKSIELYNENVYTGSNNYYNPDFDSTLQLGYKSRPNYGSIAEQRDELENDYHNIIGPNLKSGSFTDDLPKFDNESSQIRYQVSVGKIGKGGFGSHFTINTLNSNTTFGSYLRRSASQNYAGRIEEKDRPKLGEYKEIDDIDY